MKAAVWFALVIAACGPGIPGGPTINNHTESELQPVSSPVVSADILSRDVIANEVGVKHILIAWKDLQDGRVDERALKRTKADAETLVKLVLEQIKGGADFDALMKQYSEDPGSALTGRVYKVSPQAELVSEFKQLGMRLRPNEIGVVQSDYGFHIIKRVE
jgi:peptidyl-prolyl cis-trans isomerase D